jgi:hypothetical protein
VLWVKGEGSELMLQNLVLRTKGFKGRPNA